MAPTTTYGVRAHPGIGRLQGLYSLGGETCLSLSKSGNPKMAEEAQIAGFQARVVHHMLWLPPAGLLVNPPAGGPYLECSPCPLGVQDLMNGSE